MIIEVGIFRLCWSEDRLYVNLKRSDGDMEVIEVIKEDCRLVVDVDNGLIYDVDLNDKVKIKFVLNWLLDERKVEELRKEIERKW